MAKPAPPPKAFDYYHWLKEELEVGNNVLIEQENSWRRDDNRTIAKIIGLNKDTIVVQTSCDTVMEFSRNKGCKRKANGGFEDTFIRPLTSEYFEKISEEARKEEGVGQKKEVIRSIIKKIVGETDCCQSSFGTSDTNIPIRRLVWIDTQLDHIDRCGESFERFEWEPDQKVTKSGVKIF